LIRYALAVGNEQILQNVLGQYPELLASGDLDIPTMVAIAQCHIADQQWKALTQLLDAYVRVGYASQQFSGLLAILVNLARKILLMENALRNGTINHQHDSLTRAYLMFQDILKNRLSSYKPKRDNLMRFHSVLMLISSFDKQWELRCKSLYQFVEPRKFLISEDIFLMALEAVLRTQSLKKSWDFWTQWCFPAEEANGRHKTYHNFGVADVQGKGLPPVLVRKAMIWTLYRHLPEPKTLEEKHHHKKLHQVIVGYYDDKAVMSQELQLLCRNA